MGLMSSVLLVTATFAPARMRPASSWAFLILAALVALSSLLLIAIALLSVVPLQTTLLKGIAGVLSEGAGMAVGFALLRRIGVRVSVLHVAGIVILLFVLICAGFTVLNIARPPLRGHQPAVSR